MRLTKTLLLVISIVTLIAAGCSKDNDIDAPTNCVVLTQGEWKFKLIGFGKYTFVGELHQDGCHVWQANGGFFDGPLEDTFWSGTNTEEGFSFEGNFTGALYDEFEGTLTITTDNTTYDLLGYSVK